VAGLRVRQRLGVSFVAMALAVVPVAHAMTPDEAANRIGQEVSVEGEVPTVVCSPLACLLSFTNDFSGLAVSIPGDAIGRFPPPRETYGGRRVRVRGTVVDRNGKPRIEVLDPANLQLVGGSAPAPGPFVRVDPSSGEVETEGAVESDSAPAAAAPPPDEAPPETDGARSRVVDAGRFVSRAGGPREPSRPPSGPSLTAGLSGGPEDAAMVEATALHQKIKKLEQENAALADTVAALQERLDALEQSGVRQAQGVDPSQLPYRPDYVVPGESSTRLQQVKRGWSAERVLRALGAPLNTTTEANGFMTWYYANGRAVTLDPRGRVESSIGF
jgi:hypothetical protein